MIYDIIIFNIICSNPRMRSNKYKHHKESRINFIASKPMWTKLCKKKVGEHFIAIWYNHLHKGIYPFTGNIF